MLTAVKNQLKVSFLSIKYAVMKELLNKVTFITNVVFMILNNASFIIQWIILFSLKENFGGYTFNKVLLLWAIASSTYGVAHFFFKKAFSLSDIINSGKLDAFLVQPKNVLISAITTDVEVSAIGDMLYGIIVFFLSGASVGKFFLFVLFSILGGIIIAALAVIYASLSFWIRKADIIADNCNNICTFFGTYPDSIFKGAVKVLLYTVVPVGVANYLPVHILYNFNPFLFLIVLIVTIFFVLISFLMFYKGLKRYSSSNLMSARI